MRSPGFQLRALVALGSCFGCAAQIAPEAVHESAPARSQESEGDEHSCPRVERAARTWSGFLVDVPSEAMGLALEVVVPIQAALGHTFCPPLLRDCRPATLLSIELTDALANDAQLRVALESAQGTRELPLRLRSDSAGSWRAEPASLAQYLGACRKP